MKILIVEDEKILRETLFQRISEENDFQVFSVGNGEEGLAMAIKIIPDLILADLKMPIMDGLTMMKEIYKNDKTRGIRIIFLTNYDTNEDMINFISQAKTCYYLIKSNISITDIIDKIKSCLDVQKQE